MLFRSNKLIYFALREFIFPDTVADVAELADALDSKSGIREDVWVRPPPSAPIILLKSRRLHEIRVSLIPGSAAR